MGKDKLSLKQIQQEALKILIKIDEICKNENLIYYLAYGTLIGAIRHNGIIPWDDDIDIMMPRPDYDKLEAYFISHKDELFPLQMFGPNINAQYPYMINRISDCNYIIETENEKTYGLGLFVDIYPLDALGNTLKKARQKKAKGCKLASLCFLSTRLKFTRGNTKSLIKTIVKIPAFYISKVIGKDYFFKKLHNLSQLQNYADAVYVGCVVWAADDGYKGVYKKEWLGKGQIHEFEGMPFNIPNDFDSILKNLYGDYMTPPPENECIGHHFYKAYRRVSK